MFGLAGLLGPLLAGLALVAALTAFVAYERKAGADKVRAELAPKLAACAGEIAKQNEALAALAKVQAEKQAKAAQALAGATKKARVWEDNAAKLRAVLTAPRKAGEAVPTDCKAAWDEIRRPSK